MTATVRVRLAELRWTWDVPSQSLPTVLVGTAFSAALSTLVLAVWSWAAP